MTDDDKALVERVAMLPDGNAWPSTVELLCDLRDRIEALSAENERLASIVRGWHWLAVGPDEMGDYLHQRELIKASEPYANPALIKAIAAFGETE